MRGIRQPLQRDEADRSKPHPGSCRQEPGEIALCYTFGTTAEDLAVAVFHFQKTKDKYIDI